MCILLVHLLVPFKSPSLKPRIPTLPQRPKLSSNYKGCITVNQLLSQHQPLKMPRKQITPIFQKVSNLLKISILLAKITRKPIIPRFKKSRKIKKEFNLLKHYNYGYIQEYQFSPSNTPPICYRRKLFKKRSHKDLCSIFFLSKCLGRLRDDQGEDHGNYNYPIDNYHLEALPAAMTEEDTVDRELLEFSDSCGEEDSVDERAERFIERFYQEMRM